MSPKPVASVADASSLSVLRVSMNLASKLRGFCVGGERGDEDGHALLEGAVHVPEHAVDGGTRATGTPLKLYV